MEYLTADYIVKQFLIDKKQSNEQGYQWALNSFYRGLKDLNLSTIADVKAGMFKLGTDYSITLPDNSQGFTRIGIMCEDGCIEELVRNPKMAMYHQVDECGNNKPNECDCKDFEGKYYFLNNEYINTMPWQTKGRQFGIMGGSNKAGYYKELPDRSKILLDVELGVKEVYVEYLVSSDNTEEGKIISIAEEAILAYMHMKDVSYDKTSSLGEKQIRQQAYNQERNKLLMKLKGFTIKEFINVARKHVKLSPKI